MGDVAATQSTTLKIKRYISAHPAVKECLRRGLINHSELAREIANSLKLESHGATVAAIRRYALRLSAQQSVELDIDRMFRSSQVVVRSSIIVAVLSRPVDFDRIHALVKKAKSLRETVNVIEGEYVVTLIAGSKLTGQIRGQFRNKLDRIVENLAQITITLPRKSMTTPGVSARLSSMLAQAGINLIEEITCSGEYLIVISEKDIKTALELLKF